jgi:hypothetical protein
MSKLPTDFVKAPAAQAKPRAPRPRKQSLISAEPVADPRTIQLHLSEDEYAALEAARQALHQAGSEVTLEHMIHRVFADWMVRARGAADTAAAPARDDRASARLRDFVAAPLKMWRELAAPELTRRLRSYFRLN